MPAKYNWAIIRNGETFQSLVNTLIHFEKPGSRVFGRSGKDAAQDARSEEGNCVYQYKFHDQPTISKTINDALRELGKIKTYRQPSDSRHSLWRNAQEWVLVTNVRLNPGDAARWDTEVVPEFKLSGLDAKMWGLEQLDALLTKHPQVTEAYFEGKNRCFLSLEEAVVYAEADEIGAAGLRVGLEGRAIEMSAITAFLQGPKSLLCFHGPGGIGKSRLLLEIGRWAQREGFQVLSANEATMSQSDTWFASIPFTEKTLLLVDEPQDPRLVRLMAEQLRSPSSQMKSWKVLIAVRSPKDPVMKAVVDMTPDLRAPAVSLSPLSTAAARQLAQNLIANSPSLVGLSDDRKAEMALHLAKLGNQYPIWIAMAVSVLSKHGHLASLPSTVEEIAAKYLAEVIEHSSERIATKQQTQELLRWLAIYEEVNADDTAAIAFITKQAGFLSQAAFDECLNSLVVRKFVVRRGINGRLFAIKPDVMREFVLRTWLTRAGEAGIETTVAAKALVKLLVEGQNNKPIPRHQQIIRSLAKAELAERFQGRALDLLSPLIAEVKMLAKNGTVLQQQSMIGLIGSFAFARIPDLLEIVRIIRTNPKDTLEIENILLQKTVVTHETIISQLGWPIFEAAHYAFTTEERTAVLQEMAQLVLAESRMATLNRNDGKRAESLLVRMIAGGSNFYSSFQTEAFALAEQYARRLTATPSPDAAELTLAKTLCSPFLALERERTSFTAHSFTVESWFISLQSPDGIRRGQLKSWLRGVLTTSATAMEVRLVSWELLSYAHSSANRAVIQPKKQPNSTFEAEIRSDLNDDLTWCLDFLKKTDLPIAELKAARHIWDWHHRFEKTPELKVVADQCEEIYRRHPGVAAFDVFFSPGQYQQVEAKALEIADALGTKGTKESIHEFLDQVTDFGGPSAFLGNVMRVAEPMARYWETNQQIENFVRDTLTLDPSGIKFTFATNLLDRRLNVIRASGDAKSLLDALRDFGSIPATPPARHRLMSLLYSRPHPLNTGLLTVGDLEFILEQVNTDKEMRASTKLHLLSGVCNVDRDKFQTICTEIWETADDQEKLKGFLALVEGMSFLNLFGRDYPALQMTSANYDWLLSLMVKLPDLDDLPDGCHWELAQLLERFGTKSMAWLLDAIGARIALAEKFNTGGDNRFKVVGWSNKLTAYVARLSTSTPLTNELKSEFEKLLGYNDREDMLGYYLPQYAAELDPHGVFVPELIVAHVEGLKTKDKNSVRAWSRFAGFYGFNTPAWARIAKASLAAGCNFIPQEKVSIYDSLLPQGGSSSSYPAGEMDPRPERELLLRRSEAESEAEPLLVPFRQWNLNRAQMEYDHALARFQEEEEE